MKLKDLFEKWGLTGLKIKLPILELNWAPNDVDKDAAWDMYVELLTRITTQPLPNDHGIESTALQSVHKLFSITRSTLKHHGRNAAGFCRIAIIVLNQIVRPFTAKWHKMAENGAFEVEEQCMLFRNDLHELQIRLRNYTKLLADLAEVEDFTDMQVEDAAN